MPNATQDIKISRPFLGTAMSSSKDTLSARLANEVLKIRPPLSKLESKPPEDPITLVCISDTHNARPALPAGGILLHAGDLSEYGTFTEIQAQLTWLNSQPHTHKIVIAGNHDLLLDSAFVAARPWHSLENGKPGRERGELEWGGITYLENSSVEIVVRGRRIRVFGSPYVPKCGSFAFQYPPHSDYWKDIVPDGTDVLIAHTPPALYADGGKGCPHLLREIRRVRPKVVVCGHIHHARGRVDVPLVGSQKVWEEVVLSDGLWKWFGLLLLLWHVLKERVWDRVEDGEKVAVVNAAFAECQDAITMML